MMSMSAGNSVRSLLENFAEHFFFARMRAAAEENRPVCVDPEGPQDLPGQIRINPSSQLDRI